MFRTFARKFLPNPLDWKLKRAAKQNAKTVLLCWNRGLGDIALGIAAIVHRIRVYLPGAKISVLTRENLKDGFSLLDGLEIIAAKDWKRGEPYDWKKSLPQKEFDLVLEKPSPTDWCRWQHMSFTPRLKWNWELDLHHRKFDLDDGFTYIGVQVVAETNYGLWRNYPEKRWNELFDFLEKRGDVKVILFGFASEMKFHHPMICDFRGKTSFFELLSLIKNRCFALIVPDSGIASMTYYLDESFPMRLITLWADPNHGILKQGVASPNPQLVHIPLIGERRDLSTVAANQVLDALFPKKVRKPLLSCAKAEDVGAIGTENTACVILAGGLGSRLGFMGPKGLFPILNKTLFQHHLEKAPPKMPVAIMISPQNSEETKAYFEKNGFFGRKILFFEQTVLPLLDEKYRAVGVGPDGNGSVYASLLNSGILDEFERLAVDSVFFIPIENPLADPVDGRLLALKADVAIKCVKRIKGESMGALADDLSIVEYFDVAEDDYSYSYAGQTVLSMPFLRKASAVKLPLHWVRKKASIGGREMIVWKREKFLFDAFPIAAVRAALCYEREVCYAPIKGPEQKEAVEKLLRKKYT
jgi:hypothetical protein